MGEFNQIKGKELDLSVFQSQVSLIKFIFLLVSLILVLSSPRLLQATPHVIKNQTDYMYLLLCICYVLCIYYSQLNLFKPSDSLQLSVNYYKAS